MYMYIDSFISGVFTKTGTFWQHLLILVKFDKYSMRDCMTQQEIQLSFKYQHNATVNTSLITRHYFLSCSLPCKVFILMMLNLFYPSHSSTEMWQLPKPCHVGTHWKALAEYSQVSTHLPGFQSFLRILYHFVLVKSATSSIRVKEQTRIKEKVQYQIQLKW